MKRVAVLVVAIVMALGTSAAAWSAPLGDKVSTHAKKPKPTSTAAANDTFGVAPADKKGADGRPYFTFDTTPNGQLTDHLAITNYTKHPETLSVYPVDAVPGANGAIAFPNESAPRRQAGAWLAIGTPHHSGKITLEPRSMEVLPVRVSVPANAPPGDHVGAVVVSLASKVSGTFGQGGAQKVTLNQRIAVRVVFRVTGPLHSLLTINNLKATYHGRLDPFGRGYTSVHYVVHNAGNDVLGGPQLVTVHGLVGEHIVAPTLVGVPPLLPGASYPVTVRVPSVYPELFMSAKVTITTQGLQGEIDPHLVPATSSVHFLAIPWILLVVLLLLILGFALWYWRRRRKRRLPPDEELAGKAPVAPSDPEPSQPTETVLS